jgi:hypothetical protein
MKKIILGIVTVLFWSCSKEDTPINTITPITYKSVQKRLIENETPLSIYNSGIILDSLYGKTYKGGYIYYLDIVNGNGLVASTEDNSTGINWRDYSYYGETTPSLYAVDTYIGSGQMNTNTIIAKFKPNGNFTAAQFCDDLVFNGYSDWFLPSKDEMYLMTNKLQSKIGLGAYWTSSNYSDVKAWLVNRYPLASELSNKWQSNTPTVKIRATRKF